MIQLADNKSCTGCACCYNICSHNAITMQEDPEGFLQPVIDQEKCVECGLCVKRCPALNPYTFDVKKRETYALINYKDREKSSSGGAFSFFARCILNKGGVVFGATMDEHFQVKHIMIDREEDLFRLRGSKYVQSYIGDSYKQVRDNLNRGLYVLFVGTSCQVAGLYTYLGNKRYEEKLVTLDLVCHGVPSQKMFDLYLEKLKKSTRLKGENIKGFRFRKFDSWDYRPAIKLTETKWHILTLTENAYMNAFFEGIIFRESCYCCIYCNTNRIGTFTIADFWGIGRHGQKFNKNVACGVSLVIDNEEKMEELLMDYDDEIYVEKRSLQEAVIEQQNLKNPMERPKERNNCIRVMFDSSSSLSDFLKTCNLPWKEDFKYKTIRIAKNIIYSLRLYNVYKTVIYKLGK